MIFDVQTILKTDGARVPVQGKVALPEDFQNMEISFVEDAVFSGTLENIGGVLELSGDVSGSFTVPCARCMKEVAENYRVSVNETLAHEDAEVSDRDDVIPFSGNSVDLGSAIWPNVLLALGTKYLCKPDCKGLCPMCGVDLNEASCNCKHDDIDPRLAGLADLLK